MSIFLLKITSSFWLARSHCSL